MTTIQLVSAFNNRPPVDWTPGSIPPPFYNLPGCNGCGPGRGGVTHTGSTVCRSHSLASGGSRTDCTCDACF